MSHPLTTLSSYLLLRLPCTLSPLSLSLLSPSPSHSLILTSPSLSLSLLLLLSLFLSLSISLSLSLSQAISVWYLLHAAQISSSIYLLSSPLLNGCILRSYPHRMILGNGVLGFFQDSYWGRDGELYYLMWSNFYLSHLLLCYLISYGVVWCGELGYCVVYSIVWYGMVLYCVVLHCIVLIMCL